MPLEVLTGDDMPALLERAQGAIGADAVVVRVRRVAEGGRRRFELVAADPVTAARMAPARVQPGSRAAEAPAAPARPESVTADPAVPRRRASAAAGARPVRRFPWIATPRARARASGPRVIAVVGPTGAGKTTTIAKLAGHAAAFGRERTAFLGLDTFRIAGFEQLREYAEIARIPCELAWDARDLDRARRRLADADVLLVDTAGRGPGQSTDVAATRTRLLELAPDEVHLVLPAGLSMVAARAVVARHLTYGLTHVLPTKLDEYPADRVPFEVAAAYGLPLRWLADGQGVPQDLQPAAAGVVPTAAGR